MIPPDRQAETYLDGAFWCSTVMSLLDFDGTVKYVWNPFSLVQLKEKLKAVDSEITQLKQTAATLELNIEDKKKALKLDTATLRLPGQRPAPTAISTATSVKELTKERIKSMEGTLHEMKKTRWALEKKIEALN